MTVTGIEKRRKGFCALYIDGEFVAKIDTEILLSHRIDVGNEIDDEKLKEVLDASNLKRAKDKAMWLVSFRDHSQKELTDKIAKDYGYEAAQKAIERLVELNLVSDERYASRYASDLINIKHLSKSGAIRKLREKGIDKDLAQQAVDAVECDFEDSIRTVIEKKYLRYLNDEKGRRRCVNALLRLGYSYSDINSVIREYTDTDEYDY